MSPSRILSFLSGSSFMISCWYFRMLLMRSWRSFSRERPSSCRTNPPPRRFPSPALRPHPPLLPHRFQPRNRGRTLAIADALAELDQAIAAFMTLTGFTLDGMTRDPGWHFMSLGRRIERLAFQSLALSVAFRDGADSGLSWLLNLADSTVTYRSRYMARPEWLPVLDLLILDGANPRSVIFQTTSMASDLAKLELNYGACGSDLLAAEVAVLRKLNPARDLQQIGRAHV